MICHVKWTTEHTWNMLRLLLRFNDLMWQGGNFRLFPLAHWMLYQKKTLTDWRSSDNIWPGRCTIFVLSSRDWDTIYRNHTLALCLCLSRKPPHQKPFLSVNINKHSFVAARKEICVPRQHGDAIFFFFFPSPPILSLWGSSSSAAQWRHICMTKKETRVSLICFPLHAFALVLLAGPAHQGQIIVWNLAHSSFSFLCLAVMMVSLLRCNRAGEPIMDSEFSWLQEEEDRRTTLLHFVR